MKRGRLGLIPLPGDKADTHVAELLDALTKVLGIPIEIHKAGDYRALVTAIEQGLVQFAWLPPLSAARAKRAKTITPIAINMRNSATSYMTGLIARKGGRVQTLADLKGVRVGWVDRESAAGYVVIRASLRQLGVSLTDAFKEELFLRSHAEVARAVRTGAVDVGATCFNFSGDSAQIARSGYADDEGLSASDVTLLAYTGPIPADLFAVHVSVPVPLVRKLEAAFFAAPSSSPSSRVRDLAKALVHADDFARPTPRHMEMLDTLFETVIAPRSYPAKKKP